MQNQLVLVDGSSYFFRAFHALPPLTNSKGQPTGAIYGVVNMVKRLLKDYQPSHIAVVFDAKGKTFREDWYPEYKAHRPPMPNELSSQFQPLVSLLRAMGLPVLIVEGVEADDVIGTLAHLAGLQQLPVLISTSDKDMAQLVNDHVTLINTMSNQRLDHDNVLLKFGVTPAQMIDYLTLVGDTSDNIPGVPGCGSKTAVKWLTQYQTLDNLLAHADCIKGKIGEKFRNSIPNLPLSKKLVTIKLDLDLSLSPFDLTATPPLNDTLITLTQDLEFKTWLAELKTNNTAVVHPTPPSEPTYELITTAPQLNRWIQALSSATCLCLHTKGTSTDPLSAELIGLALAIEPLGSAYIPFKTEQTALNSDTVIQALKPFLEDPTLCKIGHELKYDYNLLKTVGITLQGLAYDLVLESYLLDSTDKHHDMSALAIKYLHHTPNPLKTAADKALGPFHERPLNQTAPLAANEVALLLTLHQTLYPLMIEPLKQVLSKIEAPLISVLADMERQGVLIDENLLLKHGERLKSRITTLMDEAILLAGKPFNLNSPKQLLDILYQEQHLPVLAKTPTGQPSTAESVLQELALEYRLPAVILEYRGLTKLVSTYIDALPRKINPITHRVHTSYNQAVTATGRLSSSDPNLQNIPIRSEEGRLIRKAFIAPPDHVILAADYSQIELRIMAHLSQDAGLLKAFAEGLDIHTATASELFALPIQKVNSEQRRQAKVVNFGLMYGMSAFGLAKQLGLPRQEAQQIMDRYFERYPQVAHYMKNTRQLAHDQGFVETLFGRRLYLPDINARNQALQKAAERAAINAPMQGTAADLIKKAMLSLNAWQHSLPQQTVHMIMQVHDELVFEIHHTVLETAQQTIRTLMEHAIDLSVPLLVSIGTGHDWDEAH